jgi:hypothetical protein
MEYWYAGKIFKSGGGKVIIFPNPANRRIRIKTRENGIVKGFHMAVSPFKKKGELHALPAKACFRFPLLCHNIDYLAR